jgi:hypothetical protein
MTIFYLLNGIGVMFLLYVLANFWKEGHQPKNNAWSYAAEGGRRDRVDMIVVTHPISHFAQGGLSVIPFRELGRYSDKSAHGMIPSGAPKVPARRISTR